MPLHWRVLARALLPLCLLTEHSSAQFAEELAVAQQLFKQAQEAEEAEDWTRCERVLEEAIAIVETPGLRFHIAYCREQQSRWVQALVDYRRAQELLDSGVSAADVEELLAPAIARLDKDLPRLRLEMQDVPEGADLFLDGNARSLSLLGRAVPVDPGARTVALSAPGYEPYSLQFNLLPREERDLQIVLIPKKQGAPAVVPGPVTPPEPRASPAEVSADSRGLGAKGIVLISEGVLALAGVGSGALLLVRAAELDRQRSDVTEALGSTSSCPSANANRQRLCVELERLVDEPERYRNYATASFITAGVATAALIGTWVLWPDEQNKGEAASSRRDNKAFRVVSWGLAPTQDGGLGAQLGGVW